MSEANADIIDDKLDQTTEVVEELQYAIDETAGEGGVIENLEAIAIDLQSILACGQSLDGAGFKMYNIAMRSNLRRLGMDHVDKVPSLESFEDPVTSRGATRIAMEGVFSAIGDALKKVWEWIVGIFKNIGKFFTGNKESVVKTEEKKDVINAEVKDKAIDLNKTVSIELPVSVVKKLAIVQNDKSQFDKDLAGIVKDCDNVSVLVNQDMPHITDTLISFFDGCVPIIEKAIPAISKAKADNADTDIQGVALQYLAPLIVVVNEYINKLGKPKFSISAVKHKTHKEYMILPSGAMGEGSPEIKAPAIEISLAGGLIAVVDDALSLKKVSDMVKDMEDKTKAFGWSLEGIKQARMVLEVKHAPVEINDTIKLDVKVGDLKKYCDEMSKVVKETIVDSDYEDKLDGYLTWSKNISDRMLKLATREFSAAGQSKQLNDINNVMTTMSSTAAKHTSKTASELIGFNRHLKGVNEAFTEIYELAVKAAA